MVNLSSSNQMAANCLRSSRNLVGRMLPATQSGRFENYHPNLMRPSPKKIVHLSVAGLAEA